MRHMLIGCLLAAAASCGSKSTTRCDASSVLVEARYPGAGLDEVEHAVAVPLEAALAGPDVRDIHTVVEPGVARLHVFPRGNVGDLAESVRQRLATISSLPDDVESPWLFPLATRATQLIAVSGEASPLADVQAAANRVRLQLEQRTSVHRVMAVDSSDAELTIELDPLRLGAYGLDPNTVVTSLRTAQVQTPGGVRTGAGNEFVVAVTERLDADLGRVVVAQRADSTPVYLADIATIRTVSPVVRSTLDGRPAVLLAVLGGPLTAVDLGRAELPAGMRVELLAASSAVDCASPPDLGLVLPAGPHLVVSRVVFPPGTAPVEMERVLARLADEATARLRADGVEARAITHSGVVGEVGLGVNSGESARAAASAAARVAANTPGVQVSVHGGELATGIVRLGHEDPAHLSDAVDELGRALGSAWTPGAVAGQPTLSFRLLDGARALGVTERDIARAMRLINGGVEVSRMQRGTIEVRAVVSMSGGDRFPDDLSIPIATPAGGLVPLGELVAIEREPTRSRIDRYDGHRVGYVLTGRARGDASLESRVRDARASLMSAHPGLTVDVVTSGR